MYNVDKPIRLISYESFDWKNHYSISLGFDYKKKYRILYIIVFFGLTRWNRPFRECRRVNRYSENMYPAQPFSLYYFSRVGVGVLYL